MAQMAENLITNDDSDSRRAIQSERSSNFRNNLERRRLNIHCDGRLWFLKVCELIGQDCFGGKVSVALLQPRSNQIVAALEIHQANFVAYTQFVAIRLLQRGTGKNSVLSLRQPADDGVPQSGQPRFTIGVCECDSLRHLLYVGGRVELVSIGEL